MTKRIMLFLSPSGVHDLEGETHPSPSPHTAPLIRSLSSSMRDSMKGGAVTTQTKLFAFDTAGFVIQWKTRERFERFKDHWSETVLRLGKQYHIKTVYHVLEGSGELIEITRK